MGMVTDPRTGQTADIQGIDQATLDAYLAQNGNIPGDRSIAQVFAQTASDGGRGGDADKNYDAVIDAGFIHVPIPGLGRNVLPVDQAAAYLATAYSSADPRGAQLTAAQVQPSVDALVAQQSVTPFVNTGAPRFSTYGSSVSASSGGLQPAATAGGASAPAAASSPTVLVALGILLKLLGVF